MPQRVVKLRTEKLYEHTYGFLRIAHTPPHSLAFALGLLSLAWGACVTFLPQTWEEAPFYHALVSFMPAQFVGVPMIFSGLVQVIASTNGIMLTRIAQAAIVIQTCTWGAVACSAALTHAPSTGTANYAALSLLSLLLFWQWQSAARRAGKLPPP